MYIVSPGARWLRAARATIAIESFPCFLVCIVTDRNRMAVVGLVKVISERLVSFLESV